MTWIGFFASILSIVFFVIDIIVHIVINSKNDHLKADDGLYDERAEILIKEILEQYKKFHKTYGLGTKYFDLNEEILPLNDNECPLPIYGWGEIISSFKFFRYNPHQYCDIHQEFTSLMRYRNEETKKILAKNIDLVTIDTLVRDGYGKEYIAKNKKLILKNKYYCVR